VFILSFSLYEKNNNNTAIMGPSLLTAPQQLQHQNNNDFSAPQVDRRLKPFRKLCVFCDLYITLDPSRLRYFGKFVEGLFSTCIVCGSFRGSVFDKGLPNFSKSQFPDG
jgi:hypothetical protein